MICVYLGIFQKLQFNSVVRNHDVLVTSSGEAGVETDGPVTWRARLSLCVQLFWPGRRGTCLLMANVSLLVPGIAQDFPPVFVRSSETAWRSNQRAGANAVLLPRFL